MAVLYKMRAIAQSDSSYVFWTASEPDLTGSGAPEAVVIESISVDSFYNSGGGSGATYFGPQTTLHNPVSLYNATNFNGTTLIDEGSVGEDLSIASGTPTPFKFPDFTLSSAVQSDWINTQSGGLSAGANAGYRTVGAITVLVTVYIFDYGGANWIMACAGDAETLATNYLYCILIGTGGVINWFQEYGSGSDSYTPFSSHEFIYEQATHLAITRASDGVTLKLYINGEYVDSATASHAAEGGTDTYLTVGQNNGGATSHGLLGSTKIVMSELSESEIAAEYNSVLVGG